MQIAIRMLVQTTILFGSFMGLSRCIYAEDFVAVVSKISNGYVRSRLEDGSFAPETYIFKEGGPLRGKVADDTFDKMTFDSIRKIIAGQLSSRKYYQATNPKSAKLLLVVYWGTTRAPAETAGATPNAQRMERLGPNTSTTTNLPGYDAFKDNWMLAQSRAQAFGEDLVNEQDAMMLGYDSASDPDLRKYRYFVVLLAYDLQALMRDREKRLLWQTRFSMSEHSNQFDKQLKPMVVSASAYFGRDSAGLRHDPVPEGRVEIGEVKTLGTVLNADSGANIGTNNIAALAPDGAHVAFLTARKGELELAIVDTGKWDEQIVAEIPTSNGNIVELAWIDSDRMALLTATSEILSFDRLGKRLDIDPRGATSIFADQSGRNSGESVPAKVRSILEEKFPERKVEIVSSDTGNRRFLFTTVAQGNGGRLFVFDYVDDLIFELGQSDSSR